MGKKIMPGSVMYSRCEALAKKYNDEHMSWEYIKAQDTLMRYSDEFRQCVAELCGVDPDTGEPIWPAEPAEPEDVPESEQVQEAPAADNDEPGPSDEELAKIEAEAVEEADPEPEPEPEPEPPKKRRGRPRKNPEPEPEPEEEAEEEEVVSDTPDVRPWNLCHWCQQDAAVAAVYVYVQDDGDPSQRMVRCEHLCRSCADSFWSAVREAQFACMSAEVEGEGE